MNSIYQYYQILSVESIKSETLSILDHLPPRETEGAGNRSEMGEVSLHHKIKYHLSGYCTMTHIVLKFQTSSLKSGDCEMWRVGARSLLWVMILILKKIVESILVAITLLYLVFVVDIYINTEKLSKVSPAQYVEAENIAHNPKFTKGPVVFRVEKGTLIFSLFPYFNHSRILGYAPFFIFPHHKTVIISEEMVKSEHLDALVAHELGHIQGGLAFFGTRRDMEKYANSFELEIVGAERYNSYIKYLEKLAKEEP